HKALVVGRPLQKKSRESREPYSFRSDERQFAMKEIYKIGMDGPAASAVSHVILEFYELRFGDLPTGRQCAELLEILGMGPFRIQHCYPHGEASGAVHRRRAQLARPSSTPPVPDSNGAAR